MTSTNEKNYGTNTAKHAKLPSSHPSLLHAAAASFAPSKPAVCTCKKQQVWYYLENRAAENNAEEAIAKIQASKRSRCHPQKRREAHGIEWDELDDVEKTSYARRDELWMSRVASGRGFT